MSTAVSVVLYVCAVVFALGLGFGVGESRDVRREMDGKTAVAGIIVIMLMFVAALALQVAA